MKLRLKELRKAKGLTQREVADAAGIAVSYYTELELEKKPINSNRLEAIARVFGVSEQELFVGHQSELARDTVSLDGLSNEARRIVIDLARFLAQQS